MGVWSYNQMSLRAKILAIGLGALLVSTISLGMFALNRGEKAILEANTANLEQTAQQAANRIGDVLSDSGSDVSIWSKLDVAPMTLDNNTPKFFAEFAKQAIQNKAVYSRLVLARIDGSLFAMNEVDKAGKAFTTHPLSPASFSGEAWFDGALASKGLTLYGPFVPKAVGTAANHTVLTKNEVAVAQVVLDLMDDPVGMWVSFLDWDWFESYFTSLLVPGEDGAAQFVFLAGAEGKVIGKAPSLNLSDETLTQLSQRSGEAMKEAQRVKTPSGAYLIAAKPILPAGFKSAPAWTIVVAQQEEAALASVVRFRYLVLTACLVLSLLGAALIRHYAEKAIQEVTTPLFELGKGIQSLQAGDLTARVAPAEDPAMARLADSFNETCIVLARALNEVDTTTHAVQTSTGSVSDAIDNFAQREEEMRGVVSAVAKASSQMVSTLNEVNANCKSLERQAEESRQTAAQGAEKVDATRQAMEEMAHSVGEITQAMADFRNRLDRVANVSIAIDKIASESKLLALNATIEAAHAGDSGKGFAVVADEMKKLAQQSANMSREIGAMIEEIKAGSGDVDQKVDASRTLSAQGLSLANQTEEALSRIRAAAERTTSGIVEISNELNQQSQTASRIPTSLGSIQEISGRTRTDLDQIRSTAEHLLASSKNMEEVLRKFRRS